MDRDSLVYRMAFHLTVADTLGPVHPQLITCTPKCSCAVEHYRLHHSPGSKKKALHVRLLDQPVVFKEKGYNLYVSSTAAKFLDVFVSC